MTDEEGYPHQERIDRWMELAWFMFAANTAACFLYLGAAIHPLAALLLLAIFGNIFFHTLKKSGAARGVKIGLLVALWGSALWQAGYFVSLVYAGLGGFLLLAVLSPVLYWRAKKADEERLRLHERLKEVHATLDEGSAAIIQDAAFTEEEKA